MPPPIVTAMCRTVASRPMTRSCWARWCASSSHSCTVTRVTCAPSPATTETTSLYSDVPECSSTTVARANRPTRTSSRPWTTSCWVPASRMRIGSSSSASAGTSSTRTPPVWAAATAAARSPGAGAPLARHSSTPIVDRVTPSGSSCVRSRWPEVASSWKSAPNRSTGVNRHSSSRPEGCGKSATAYDVVRSARDWFGTIVAALSVCAPAVGRCGVSRLMSANCSFHLELDEAVELEGVLHRELLGDGLDEAAHDHRHRLLLGHASGHQVEHLVLGHLGDGGLVAHLHVVLADVDVGVGVGAADRVDEQGVADDRALRAVRALEDLDQAAVGRAATATGDRLADDLAARVGGGVDHLGAGVLVLALAGERD